MTPEESPDPSGIDEEESSGDLSKGYSITFTVHGDGSYSIGEPSPIADEEAPEDGDTIPDLTQALKRLLNLIKSNPIGEDAQSQFDAGYEASSTSAQPA